MKEKIFRRNCPNPDNNPKCKKKIVYKNKRYYINGLKKKTVCNSCHCYGIHPSEETIKK